MNKQSALFPDKTNSTKETVKSHPADKVQQTSWRSKDDYFRNKKDHWPFNARLHAKSITRANKRKENLQCAISRPAAATILTIVPQSLLLEKVIFFFFVRCCFSACKHKRFVRKLQSKVLFSEYFDVKVGVINVMHGVRRIIYQFITLHNSTHTHKIHVYTCNFIVA